MTITNGQTATATDVNAMASTQLGLVQADNADYPAGFLVRFGFPNLVASTPAYRAKAIFVAPCDLLIEVLAVQTADMVGLVTVTAIGDGALITDGDDSDGDDGWGMKVSETVGTGIVKCARLLFDNTKTKVTADFQSTAKAFRVVPKGSTVEIIATTANTTTPCECNVTLACREFWSRE